MAWGGEHRLLSCRTSIKHEVLSDFVSAGLLLFMVLLLHNPAEDVISGTAQPSDLCLHPYWITEGLNAGQVGGGARYSYVPNEQS